MRHSACAQAARQVSSVTWSRTARCSRRSCIVTSPTGRREWIESAFEPCARSSTMCSRSRRPTCSPPRSSSTHTRGCRRATLYTRGDAPPRDHGDPQLRPWVRRCARDPAAARARSRLSRLANIHAGDLPRGRSALPGLPPVYVRTADLHCHTAGLQFRAWTSRPPPPQRRRRRGVISRSSAVGSWGWRSRVS